MLRQRPPGHRPSVSWHSSISGGREEVSVGGNQREQVLPGRGLVAGHGGETRHAGGTEPGKGPMWGTIVTVEGDQVKLLGREGRWEARQFLPRQDMRVGSRR